MSFALLLTWVSHKHKKVDEKRFKIIDKMSGYDKSIILKTYRLPNGVLENFFIDDNSDSVQILPVTEDGHVITVQQFRAGIEMETVELPGGSLEKGEDPLKAAERELLEETGFEGELTFLGKVNYNPYSTGNRYMFVAENCKKVERLDLDDNEFLIVLKWTMEKFRETIRKGAVRGSDCAYAGLDTLGLL